jgi:hypothetical protein
MVVGSFHRAAHIHRRYKAVAPDHRPVHEQAGSVRGWMWTFAVATILFSSYIAYGLIQLETGQVQVVRVWPLVNEIYRSLGFWPAVLCLPALGSLYLLVLTWKLRSILKKAAASTRSQ